MSVVIFSLQPNGIEVGTVGDPTYQSKIEWESGTSATDIYLDTLKLQKVMKEALDSLLTAVFSTTVVILEPPLFMISMKRAIADVLLGKFRVFAVGFLPQTVCCIAGSRRDAGIVIDNDEKVVVPVYDYRELTPFTVLLEENETDEIAAVAKASAKAAIDIRKNLRENVVELSNRLTWLGASALTSQRTVWPLITREKYANGRQVWDSLFDMR